MPTEIRRFEAPEKTIGHATFAGDIKRAGMLFGKILRSQIPHARIKKIRRDKALSLPGVEAVITAEDFPDVKTGLTIQDEVVMARDKVRYIGEPVAAVAAIDRGDGRKSPGSHRIWRLKSFRVYLTLLRALMQMPPSSMKISRITRPACR